jgi:hypothetical protein
MPPWIGRILIIFLTVGLAALLKSNTERGLIAFAFTTVASLIAGETYDGLVTVAIIILLISNILANALLGMGLILPWSEVGIIIMTAVLMEILFSTTQHTAFGDLLALTGTFLIIVLWSHFMVPPPPVACEKSPLNSAQVPSNFNWWWPPWAWDDRFAAHVARPPQPPFPPVSAREATPGLSTTIDLPVNDTSGTRLEDSLWKMSPHQPYRGIFSLSFLGRDGAAVAKVSQADVHIDNHPVEPNVLLTDSQLEGLATRANRYRAAEPPKDEHVVNTPAGIDQKSSQRQRVKSGHLAQQRVERPIHRQPAQTHDADGAVKPERIDAPVGQNKRAVVKQANDADSSLLKPAEQTPEPVQSQEGKAKRLLPIIVMVMIYLAIV